MYWFHLVSFVFYLYTCIYRTSTHIYKYIYGVEIMQILAIVNFILFLLSCEPLIIINIINIINI